MKFFAVSNGRSTGIFVDWINCKRSVNKFPNCCFKSFGDYDDARLWLKEHGIQIEKVKSGPITKYLK